MLDAVRSHPDIFKGVAIVDMDASVETLRALKEQGIVGIALNPTFHGIDYYRHAGALTEKLAELDLFANLQVEQDQLRTFAPWIREFPVRVLIDHCGRPTVGDGPEQTGFRTLLGLAETGRVHVKLSGYDKFARTAYPFEDCRPYIDAIVGAFTLERCLWASDWPYTNGHNK